VTVEPVPQRTHYVDAAVLVPVYRDADGELRVVLLRRTEGGVHGGQVAFPGGKLDAGETPRDAALREAYEEIGLEPARVTVLGELPPLQTRASGFRIHPFLARIDRPPGWRPAIAEVAEVLEPTIAYLADPANHGSSLEKFPEWHEPVRIEFVRIGEARLWGATLRILKPQLHRLLEGAWEV
jgi:8-oxo-dGTP pyrophosphatase MutT (NUDIX family)